MNPRFFGVGNRAPFSVCEKGAAVRSLISKMEDESFTLRRQLGLDNPMVLDYYLLNSIIVGG